MQVLEPHLAVAHSREGLRERGAARAEGLHLRAGQDDAGFQPLEDLVVEAGAASLLHLGDAGNVVCRNVGAKHGRDVQDLGFRLGQLLVGHRTIGGAKIHCTRQHLADSAAAADGLVIDLNLRMLLVVFAEPLRIDGIRKGRARAVQRRLGEQGRRSQRQAKQHH